MLNRSFIRIATPPITMPHIGLWCYASELNLHNKKPTWRQVGGGGFIVVNQLRNQSVLFIDRRRLCDVGLGLRRWSSFGSSRCLGFGCCGRSIGPGLSG
jgi:hypothetical protein